MISSAGIMGYNFTRIKLDGEYSNSILNSTFRVGDRNLMTLGNFYIRFQGRSITRTKC